MKHRTLFASLILCSTLTALVGAVAADNDEPPRRPAPPQEAFDACKSAKAGDACSFTTPRGTIDGTCRTPPDLDRLVCVPKHPPGGPDGPGGGSGGSR
ncbi:MAG: hypothetical protein K8W52_12250 [Deltaproteobacteria bacterium]|nr:hypothetical protein [Deltaproteobacteria bacterium]